MDLKTLGNERVLRSGPAELFADNELGMLALRSGWCAGHLFLTDLRLAFRQDGAGLSSHIDMLRQLDPAYDPTSPDGVLASAQRLIPFGAHPVFVHTDAEGRPVLPGRTGRVSELRGRWLGLIPHGPAIGIELHVRHAITGTVGGLRLRMADPASWAQALSTLPAPPATADDRLQSALDSGVEDAATVGPLLDPARFPNLDWVHPESLDEALDSILEDAQALGIPLSLGQLEPIIERELVSIPPDLDEHQEEAWVHRQLDAVAQAIAALIPDTLDRELVAVHPVPGLEDYGAPVWLWLPRDRTQALVHAGVIRVRVPAQSSSQTKG